MLDAIEMPTMTKTNSDGIEIRCVRIELDKWHD